MLPSKINDNELSETLVSRLPLRPAATSKYGSSPMTGEAIRAAFDSSAKLIAARLNQVITLLTSGTAQSGIALLPYNGSMTLGELLEELSSLTGEAQKGLDSLRAATDALSLENQKLHRAVEKAQATADSADQEADHAISTANAALDTANGLCDTLDKQQRQIDQATSLSENAVLRSNEAMALFSEQIDLHQYTFAQGGLTAGENNAYTYRCSTFTHIPYKAGAAIDVTIADGYKYEVDFYSSDKTYISYVGWLTSSEVITVPKNTAFFKIAVAYAEDRAIEPDVAINSIKVQVSIHDLASKTYVDNRIADMKEIESLSGKAWGFYTFYYPEDGLVGYVNSSQNRIAIPEVHHFPYDVYISVDNGYQFNVAYLSSSAPSTDTFISGTSWRTDDLTIKAGTYFSLVLAREDNTVMQLDESSHIYVHGNLSIEDLYNSMETQDGIVPRNEDIEHVVQACSNHGRSDSKYKKGLSMLVAADIHQDEIALKNMIEYLNHANTIDCGISLGDMQKMTYGENDGTWYTSIVNQSDKDFYTVLGNHDIGVWNGYEGNGTSTLSFHKFIKPTLDKIGISNLATPYYAKTFDDYKVVVIILNTFDAPSGVDENGEYLISRDNEMFSQSQINWFIQALSSVPSDYHVVVAMHSIGFEHVIDEKNNFTHNEPYSLEMGYPYGYCTAVPDIINAWKNGTTLTASYQPIKYTDILPPLTVDCDFTSRGTGNFVCYLVGHDHTDKIMRCAKFKDQLIVSLVSSATTQQHVKAGDLPRIKGTKSEDALTVFSIDTDHRFIKLVRVGSNVTCEMSDRTFTSISYADTEEVDIVKEVEAGLQAILDAVNTLAGGDA